MINMKKSILLAAVAALLVSVSLVSSARGARRGDGHAVVHIHRGVDAQTAVFKADAHPAGQGLEAEALADVRPSGVGQAGYALYLADGAARNHGNHVLRNMDAALLPGDRDIIFRHMRYLRCFFNHRLCKNITQSRKKRNRKNKKNKNCAALPVRGPSSFPRPRNPGGGSESGCYTPSPPKKAIPFAMII